MTGVCHPMNSARAFCRSQLGREVHYSVACMLLVRLHAHDPPSQETIKWLLHPSLAHILAQRLLSHHLFHQCRAKWEREAAFVADQNAQSSDLVQRNIGGQMFATVPRSTLTLEDNMLSVHRRSSTATRATLSTCWTT